jgi:hypothetical protein
MLKRTFSVPDEIKEEYLKMITTLKDEYCTNNLSQIFRNLILEKYKEIKKK